MALESVSSFTLGKQTAKIINATPTRQARIFNGFGGKIFYKTASDVDTGDTEVAVGSSVTVEEVVWIISESRSQVFVENLSGVSAVDVSVSDDLTVTDKLTAKGEVEIDGALNHDGEKVGVFGVTPATRPEVKKAELTANELATKLATMGIVKVEA